MLDTLFLLVTYVLSTLTTMEPKSPLLSPISITDSDDSNVAFIDTGSKPTTGEPSQDYTASVTSSATSDEALPTSASASNAGSNPSSIYDFLVKDMMNNEELTTEPKPTEAQSNFQKFSSSARPQPIQASAPSTAATADSLFNYFSSGQPSEHSRQQSTADQDALMMQIMQNLQRPEHPSVGQQAMNNMQQRAPPMSHYADPTAHHYMQQRQSPSQSFPGAHGYPLPPLPAMSPTFAPPPQSNPPMAQPPSGFPLHPQQTAAKPQHGAPAMPTQPAAPPMHPAPTFNQPPSAMNKDSIPSAFTNPMNFGAPLPEPTKPAHSDSDHRLYDRDKPSLPSGPKNAPGTGYYTPTILSSYSFNLPGKEGGAPGDDGKSNFTFPPLVMMEVSPATLYMLHPGNDASATQPPERIAAFLRTLHETTTYTLNLIASGNKEGGPAFNELQIAMLHCTFIVNPDLRGIAGHETPFDVPRTSAKENSPYAAPSPYHMIQFRSLISQVTYVPLPEYLFDIQSTTFAAAQPVETGFKDYYSLNNVLNSNIQLNASNTRPKMTSLSLFIGQTTYRTTPSVLYYLFNVICKVEILEVEVMRKQPCAFFYVYLRDENEMNKCIEMLHKRILFDLHGVWFAQNDREEEKLRKFVRHDRERIFPVLPLPKQMMVVERRNSITRSQPVQSNPRPMRNFDYAAPQPHSAGVQQYGHPPQQQQQPNPYPQYNQPMQGYPVQPQQYAHNQNNQMAYPGSMHGYPQHNGYHNQMNAMQPQMPPMAGMPQGVYGMPPMGGVNHHMEMQNPMHLQRPPMQQQIPPMHPMAQSTTSDDGESARKRALTMTETLDASQGARPNA